MLRRVEFIGSGYEVIGSVMVDTPTMAEAYEAAEKWYRETGQDFHYCGMEIPKEYAYNEPSVPSEDQYVVGFAVDGRAYVEVTARNPYFADLTANDIFCDADWGKLDCINWKLVDIKDAKGQFCDVHEANIDNEQDYTVAYAVEGRAYICVVAADTVSAVQKASKKVGGLNFGEVECVDWKAINVEDAQGRLYDSERDLFGPTQGSIDVLIADAEQSRNDTTVNDVSKYFDEPSI